LVLRVSPEVANAIVEAKARAVNTEKSKQDLIKEKRTLAAAERKKRHAEQIA